MVDRYNAYADLVAFDANFVSAPEYDPFPVLSEHIFTAARPRATRWDWPLFANRMDLLDPRMARP